MDGPVRRLGRRARTFLRGAILAAWLVGVGGSASSCLTLKYYQSPRPASVAPKSGSVGERMARVWIDLLDRYRARRIPLAIADLLLSLALLVGAARTLARRPGAKSWLRQVCLAMVAFALVELAVRRAEWIDAANEYARISAVSDDPARVRVRFETALGAIVAVQLALFGGLVWALGRPSVVLELAPEPADASRDDEKGE